MTYCFINPVRWIAGEPVAVSAFASRVLNTSQGLIDEENIVANLKFHNDVLCHMTAGFVAPGGLPAWSATFIGTTGAVEVRPDEAGAGTVVVYQDGHALERSFAGINAFNAQAQAFVKAVQAGGPIRNSPAATAGDVRVAEAIVTSVHEGRTVFIG
jgi:predicted dehydrogenase